MQLDRVIAVRNHKTIYRDGNRCVKVFLDLPASAVLAEAHCQSSAAERGICVPRVLEVTTVDGAWAIVMAHVPGRPLTRLTDAPTDRAEGFARLAAVQREINALTCPSSLPLYAEVLHRAIATANLAPATRDALLERLARLPVGSSLCHGDLVPDNVIITPSGESCILDWPHAARGTPADDAARTCLRLRLAGDDAGETLFRAARRIDPAELELRLPIAAAAALPRATMAERSLLRRLAAGN